MTGRLADALLSPYVLAFEVASVILLVAMIGAIVIVRAEPKNDGLDPVVPPSRPIWW